MIFSPLLVPLLAAVAAAAEPQAIRTIFSEFDKPGSPGCAVSVITDGRVELLQGFGLANLEYDLPIRVDSVFDIGSTSKQFTALAMLLLERDGKLQLDDPVRKYIKELPAYEGSTLTIRHMLNHTSGLRDYLAIAQLAGFSDDDFFTDAEAVERIVRQSGLNFQPGEQFAYSNSGYFLASQIVLRLTGSSLAQFLDARVFRPLGMTHTHAHDDHTRLVRHRASAYAPLPGGGFRIDMSMLDQTGDGAVNTTIEDLAKWDAAFYDSSSDFAPLLRRMQERGTLRNGTPLDYGLGLFIDSWSGERMISHGGAFAGYRAEIVRLPERRHGVIALCNLASANPILLARRVIALRYPGKSKVFGEPPATPTPTAPAAYPMTQDQTKAFAGKYRCDDLDATYTVTATTAGQLAVSCRRSEWKFAAQAEARFTAGRSTITFHGRGFTLDHPRARGLQFYRVTN